MNIVDRGTGVPVVVVPGIQGRWEWHAPAIDALAQRGRVLTWSFADEPTAGAPFVDASCVDGYVEQIRLAMTERGVSTATLCGISYGGLIAAVFAARYPGMVSSLVLASALPPTWVPDKRVGFYLRAPRLLTPLFLLASLRLFNEIVAASPGPFAAVTAGVRHAWNAVTHMFSPSRMARRARQLPQRGLTEEVSTIVAPTMILVGEPSLDRVVPVAVTLDYLRMLPTASVSTLSHTGHLGSVMLPQEFAVRVISFAQHHTQTIDSRRRLG